MSSNSDCDADFAAWWNSPEADIFDTITEMTARSIFRCGWCDGADWVLKSYRKTRQDGLERMEVGAPKAETS